MSQDHETSGKLSPGALRYNSADAPDSFFRAVVENAADMISVIDADGVFIYACPKAADVFGFDYGSIDKLTPEHFHPDDFEAMFADFVDLVVNGGRRQLTDHRMSNGRGGWVWIQTHAINLVDDPRVKGIVMVSRDITKQKNREEEIIRAEKAIGFGHWRWDNGALGPYWSDGMFSILGLKRDEHDADMQWAADRIADDEREGIAQKSMAAMVNGESFNDIVSMRHADGSYRRLMVTGHVERNPAGKPMALVGVTQDVTELEKANNTIRQSEQEFRLLAEHSNDIISRYNIKGDLIYISPSVERLLGYHPSESKEHSWEEYMHPKDRKQVAREMIKMFGDLQTRRVSYRMMAKDGRYLWLESAVTPIYGEKGDYQGMVTCTRDISEQKTREQELMAARERAEQASLTKSRFLANMSHELRTPLNAILGFSEMMTQEIFGPMENAQYGEYAELIHESGAHLLSLISDILDMSKIEAGKYDLSFESVAIVPALEKAARMVQTRVGEGELELLLQLDGVEGCQIHADERALTQILLNVLSNAVKFTPGGGRITVSAVHAAHGRIAISVADTGVGIEKQDLERVLNPFEQVVRHAELASQGTGLGLPLVRALVDMQDGVFDIQSTPGRGTTVTIALPDADAATGDTTQAQSA